jgi:exodeoxyribonuclease V alpha subunit
METITGKVNRIKFESPDGDFKIFILKQKDNAKFSVSGSFPNLLPNAMVEVHGDFFNHPKYGLTFKALSHTFAHDNSLQAIYLYLQSIAKWIGPERARDIAEHFKDEDIEKIIEEEPERLKEIEGVGDKIVESIAEAWKENKELKSVKVFLHGLGLSKFRIDKIISKYSYNAEMIIKQNPYLLSFEGFGFTTCDYLANKLGKSPQDPLRYRYFILYMLRNCMQSGHLFLQPAEISKLFNDYNKVTEYPFKNGVVLFSEIEPHLEGLIKDGFIYKDDDKYYDINMFFYENESARLLKKIYDTPDECKLEDYNVEGFIAEYENTHKMELSDDQRDSIRSFVQEKVMIITGSPGTGKTTVIKAIVDLMVRKNISFDLLTPTGISAKKLAKTANHDARTIHRQLGYKGDKWDYHALNKYNTKVVIVDETSMVDMEVFFRLASALFSHTKVIFVGDNDQLPSVGPGAVLKHLITCGCFKVIQLRTIFRQEEQSDIIKAAKKIKDGDPDLSLFKQDKHADIWFIREKNMGTIEETIIRFAMHIKEGNKKKKEPTMFQIITPRNNGPLSVETLNIALQGVLNPPGENKKEISLNRMVIRKGDRVLIKKNNYQLDVFNGDIGKVSLIVGGNLIIDIDEFDGKTKRVEIPIKVADEMLKLAYAISVHKAQGLEYPLIIMPIVRAHGQRILQRNLLYTAITRAKKKVVVLGQGSAIEQAINNDKIQNRNTLFDERIREWMNGDGITLQTFYMNPEDYANQENLRLLLLLETGQASFSR